MKKIFKYLFMTVLGILSLVLGYLLFALLFSVMPVNTSYRIPKEGVEIFVISNGVHTDIVVPVKNSYHDWSEQIPYQHFADADSLCRYITFGWGDRGFYLDTPAFADLKTSTAFKATFFLGTTAMHVSYRRRGYTEGDHCRRMMLTAEQYCRLVDYIEMSFQKKDNQVILIPGKGYARNDNFYEAVGTYSFLKTCNIWTNKGLKISGVRTPFWSPFDKGIFFQLKKIKEEQ